MISDPRIEIKGKQFYPSKLIAHTEINFEKYHDAGKIGTIGRYKGVKIPFGSAAVSPPENIEEWEKVKWLLNLLDNKIELFRKYGGDNFTLRVAYYYKGQCNCELGVEEIHLLAKLNIPFLFSVYQVDDLKDMQ